MTKFLLCSNCFLDEGLKLDSFKLGIDNDSVCENCNSSDGKKLDKELISKLSYRFFVRGTLHKVEYGAAPIIQFNEQQTTCVNLEKSLQSDVELISKTINIGFFPYGPRLWMVGEVEPLKSLQLESEREQIFKRIIEEYPTITLNKENHLYRLRKNPSSPNDHCQYDSSPTPGNGRLDSTSLPILYSSEDIEVCIHECRTSVEDDIYVATLVPSRGLKILDLTELLEEDTTEFESLDMAIHMLFNASKHSYDICRELAKYIFNNKYDGIIYPSYFSTIRTGATPFETVFGISIRKFPLYTNYARFQVIPNIALFGTPINSGIVTVKCINKLILNKVEYDFHFGPII